MNDDTEIELEGIEKEDVVDAINDPENHEALALLGLYFEQLHGENADANELIKDALVCAKMLFEAKRYEDVVAWLDEVATKLSDEHGPDSEIYMEFAESEDLEDLRMKATDKIFGDEEEEDDDYDDDDE